MSGMRHLSQQCRQLIDHRCLGFFCWASMGWPWLVALLLDPLQNLSPRKADAGPDPDVRNTSSLNAAVNGLNADFQAAVEFLRRIHFIDLPGILKAAWLGTASRAYCHGILLKLRIAVLL